MTSYDEEHSGPDFSPAYGVQLHDPCLPESARILTRSPVILAASHGKRKDTLARSPAAARCWADTIECASSSSVSHGV